MASELAIYYTPMHFIGGVKSGATPVTKFKKVADKRMAITPKVFIIKLE